MRKIKGTIKKVKNVLFMTSYCHYFYKLPLKPKMILIESKNGSDLAGNMFAILREVTRPEYKDFDVYLSVLASKKEGIKQQLDRYQVRNVNVVETNTKAYYKCLATAKYLFTDTTFGRTYVKKEGQIITNTWHGTPLKKMGRDVEDRAFAMGNVQRNLLYADYLIYPNIYMKEKMVDAYMLRGLYEGTILNEGYPRNSVFFDPSVGQDIKRELGLMEKEIFMYMPTWRGTLSNKNTEHLLAMTEYYLQPLDRELRDDQVFYVKLHPFVSQGMDFSKYTHIKPFPDEYDAYEFMNMCDCLVTDYSSVFYDFANSKKKIILFAYDETEYLWERGLYVDLKSLPFPIVKSVKALVKELNSSKNYDDTEFLKECCTYDAPGAAERICRHVLRGEKVCEEEKIPKNGKKNVVMYGSALAKNGLTTSLLNLYNNIDLDKRNYYVSFTEMALRKDPLRTKQIPEKVGLIPMSSDASPSFMEAVAYVLYFKKNKDNKWIRKYLDRLYKRDLQKHFGGMHIDYMIQFAGYEKKIINMFQRFDGPRFIYVHNDMVQEMQTRNNQHFLTLESAYQNYDKVAVVTRDIVPPTVQISHKESNIAVVNNCHAHKEVIERADQPLAFDEDTKSNVEFDELVELLDSSKKKFISIGRFSPEKNHMMLMKAFETFSAEYPDTALIIIGGHGVLYNQTVSYANESKANIIIIKSMKNPMPILKRCDFFILSSIYEGLGLTLLEADALGIATMSTDIPGPKGFVTDYHGHLVDVSEKGLVDGMRDYMQGKIKAMNVDYDEYNKQAVAQYENLYKEYEV